MTSLMLTLNNAPDVCSVMEILISHNADVKIKNEVSINLPTKNQYLIPKPYRDTLTIVCIRTYKTSRSEIYYC